MTSPMYYRDLAELWLSTLRAQAATMDVRNRGEYRSEYLLDELFFDLVRLAGPSTFVEVGAHDGQRAVRAREVLPSARVVALEASPSNHALFSGRTDFGSLGVEYLHLAAAEQAGTVVFYVEPDEGGVVSGASSLLSRKADRGGPESVEAKVAAVRLDEFSPDEGRVCLWVDVEGANQQVLLGASGMVGRIDVLKIEVEEAEFWDGQWLSIDVLAYLLEEGMVPLVRDRANGDWQYNVLLVSKRMARAPEVVSLVTGFLERSSVRELPGLLGRARRNDGVRELIRKVRR